MPRHSKDTVAVLGIDIGENTFHLVGLNKRGAIILRLRPGEQIATSRRARGLTAEQRTNSTTSITENPPPSRGISLIGP